MYVHNSCFVNIVCNFECLLMILTDSDREFKRFQGSVNISIYQLLEMELLRVKLLRVGNREVGIRELTVCTVSTVKCSS